MAEYLPPSSRLTDWTPGTHTGVAGGIAQYRPGGASERTNLIDVTQSPYNADNTGTSNASTAIASAISAASAGDVVYLPAGTYRCTSTIDFGAKKNITVRGDGIGETIIALVGSANLFVGTSASYLWNSPASNNTITVGNTKGSTTLTIASTSAFTVGTLAQIRWDNQEDPAELAMGAVPVVSVMGFPMVRRQMVRIVAKDATTLTIEPGIFHAPQSGLTAKIFSSSAYAERVGLEDFEIDMTDSTAAFSVQLYQSHQCWLYRVKCTNSNSFHVGINDSLKPEVRQCWIAGRKGAPGPNGAAVIVKKTSAALIEHCVLADIFPCIELNQGTCGSAVLHNHVSAFAYNGGYLNINHDPHNSHNLIEGNKTSSIQSDGYFGSASEDTIFRNWICGNYLSGTNLERVLWLNRFTRNYSVIGNIIGTDGGQAASYYSSVPEASGVDRAVHIGIPNIGNSTYTGEVTPSAGTPWPGLLIEATLTTRTSDTTGTLTLSTSSGVTNNATAYFRTGDGTRYQITIGTVSGLSAPFTGATSTMPAESATGTLWPGDNAFQAYDHDVYNTLVTKANYLCAQSGTGAIPSGDELSPGDTLPDSLAYDEAPYDWPTGFDWPPFSPLDATTGQTGYRLPASYWAAIGTWPEDEEPPSEATAPNPLAFRSNAMLAMGVF